MSARSLLPGVVAAVLLSSAGLAATSVPAAAAAVANDTAAGAVEVTALPYMQTVPVADSHVDAQEGAWASGCGFTRPTGGGLWYRYTAAHDQSIGVQGRVPDLQDGYGV